MQQVTDILSLTHGSAYGCGSIQDRVAKTGLEYDDLSRDLSANFNLCHLNRIFSDWQVYFGGQTEPLPCSKTDPKMDFEYVTDHLTYRSSVYVDQWTDKHFLLRTNFCVKICNEGFMNKKEDELPRHSTYPNFAACHRSNRWIRLCLQDCVQLPDIIQFCKYKLGDKDKKSVEFWYNFDEERVNFKVRSEQNGVEITFERRYPVLDVDYWEDVI